MGGGDSTTTSVQELPAWAQPIAQQLWNSGSQTIGAMDPSQAQSPYPTVAPMNQAQQTGMGMTLGRGLSGSPLEDAAQGNAYQRLTQGAQADPYSTMSNPYMGMQNPYEGYGPAFQQMLTSSNNALADSFARGTGAQTTAQFARAGAQGGSAQQEQETNNANQLAGILGNNTNSMLQNQFNQSAGLNENYLNRNLAAYGQQQGLASNSYNQSQNGLNNLLQQIPALTGLDYRNAAAVSGVGNQQQQYSQSIFDALNNQYQQAYNAPLTQLDQYGALVRSILGNSGSSTVTGNQGGSGWGQALGGAASLASLFL